MKPLRLNSGLQNPDRLRASKIGLSDRPAIAHVEAVKLLCSLDCGSRESCCALGMQDRTDLELLG